MIKRSSNILKILEKKQSIFLFGPRGVGKPALAEECFKGLKHPLFISLLQSQNFRKYLAAPEQLRLEIETILNHNKSKDLWVAIDEIQKVPALLDEIHFLIEKFKSRIVFCLTGSSARKLKRNAANLLAGRAITEKLHPLNSREVSIDVPRALQFGTLPKVYLEHELEVARLDSYVTTYLREEIQEESLVRQTDKFARFLELAGQYNAEPINFSKLARQCSVSTKTCQEYFEILVDTLLVTRVDGWSQSVKRQLMQAPKFYFFDCGVLNAINGELRTELRSSSFRFGKLFETWLIQEIIRVNDDHHLGLRFNYWRSSTGKEVDLIISRSLNKPLLAIEIKSSEQPDIDDVESLERIASDYPSLRLICASRTERAYHLGKIAVLPWQDLLKELEEL